MWRLKYQNETQGAHRGSCATPTHLEDTYELRKLSNCSCRVRHNMDVSINTLCEIRKKLVVAVTGFPFANAHGGFHSGNEFFLSPAVFGLVPLAHARRKYGQGIFLSFHSHD
jgi:hypothetical protein